MWGDGVLFLILPRSGGTGRRAGLKIRWPQGRVGSTPSSGTIFSSNFSSKKRFADLGECLALGSFPEKRMLR